MSKDMKQMINKVKSFKQFVNENIQNEKDLKIINFDELYHGTTMDRFDDISKTGFSIRKQGEKSGHGSVLGISMTTNEEIAKEHAEWAVERLGVKNIL